MDSPPSDARGRGRSSEKFGTTRRAVLAGGGAVALTGLAGCAALDGLLDRAGEQVVGTTASAPAAFYPGRASSGASASLSGAQTSDDGMQFFSIASSAHQVSDERQVFRTGSGEVRAVPATVRAEGREIELEGWSTSAITKAQDYNASRSNKPSSEWWVGPDGDGDDDDDVDEDTLVRYLEDEPTIGERFTVCLPDAKLPGNRGSVAQHLTPQSIHSNGLIDEVREDDKVGSESGQGNGSCADSDGPVTLHSDISCGNVLSADVRTTGVPRIVVFMSREEGAVVASAPASADTDGKCALVAGGTDVTGEIILGEDRDMVMRESPDGNVSVSETLVCPVAVTLEDCPCPLPGLFYVQQIRHDDQVILAGGWTLDEGALFEDSVTLLFDEGPTEVASVTAEDIESDDYDDRIVEQFSRDRSQHGSAVISGGLDAIVESGGVPKAQLTAKLDTLLGTGDDEGPTNVSLTALDAPLVHLAGAGDLSEEQKLESARGIDKRDIRRGM